MKTPQFTNYLFGTLTLLISTMGYAQDVDYSDSTVQLSKKMYTIPSPSSLGTGKSSAITMLYGEDSKTPGKLYVPHFFIHNMTDATSTGVPENEFIIKSYYHPAIIIDNIKTNEALTAAEGFNAGNSGFSSSLVFRKQGVSQWQIKSGRDSSPNMDFQITQFSGFTTNRLTMKPFSNPSEIAAGLTPQNLLYGNTAVRGFLSAQASQGNVNRAALALEAYGNLGSGSKIWIRKGGGTSKNIEFASDRNYGDVYWAFNEDGSMMSRGANAQVTTLNNSNSNNLRSIIGATPSETFIKQSYSNSSRPFEFYIGGANIMTLSATDNYKLTVHGNAMATVWQTSDMRFKKDITKIKTAVDRLNSLNGVSYNFRTEKYKGRKFNSGRNFGFLAQEVKEILPELVMEDDEGFFAINYSGFTPIIVEALKELNDENKTLKQELEYFKVELMELKSVMKELQVIENGVVDNDNFVLHQNIPNPFNEDTYVRYTVPTYAAKSSLYVFDLKGGLLLEFNNLKAGEGVVKIEAGSLEAGLYIYKLISDGKEIGTKKMILSK